MKSDTQFFIDKVMDSIDYCFVDSREFEGAQQYLLDDIDDYTGPSIVVSFKSSGDGIVRIDVFNQEKSSKEKLILTEDNLDVEQAVGNINQMIVDVMNQMKMGEEQEQEPVEEPVDYNEKLGFDEIFEEPEEEVDGYILCKAYLENDRVMLLFNDVHNESGDIVCWTEQESHSSCNPYYPDDLIELDGKDPRVKEAVAKYEDYYSSEQNGKVELQVLPIGQMLDVQKNTHKDISRRD